MTNQNFSRGGLWLNKTPHYDSSGLSIDSHSIVEWWEKPIQEVLAESVCSYPSTRLLEIGYGLGLASKAVKKFSPSFHLIVEAHPQIAAKALRAISPNANLFVGLWEQVTKIFISSSFDGIIFDAYPMQTTHFNGSAESTFQNIREFLPEAKRLLRPGGRVSFLDFSRGLNDLRDFQLFVYETFSSIRIKTVPLSIPQTCSYAYGDTGHVIVLEK